MRIRRSGILGPVIALVVACTTQKVAGGPCESNADCSGRGAASTCDSLTGVCYDPSTVARAPTGSSQRPPATQALEGASCTKPGELRCAVDPDAGTTTGAVVFCEGGTYVKVFACPGAFEKCLSVGGDTTDEVKCGDGPGAIYYAKEGAPCVREKGAACSFDLTAVHLCRAGKWTASYHCPPSTCTVQIENGVEVSECANGGLSVGDYCEFSAGSVICSTDLTKILACSNGTTVVSKDCGSKKCTLVSTNPRTIGCQ